MTEKFNATTYHIDHNSWKAEVDLYIDEVNIYEEQLAEIISKNTDKEIRGKAESFQNKFLVHKSALDGLGNAIKKHEMTLANNARQSEENSSAHDLEYHAQINKQMEDERKIFKDLKSGFHNFLSSVL